MICNMYLLSQEVKCEGAARLVVLLVDVTDNNLCTSVGVDVCIAMELKQEINSSESDVAPSFVIICYYE